MDANIREAIKRHIPARILSRIRGLRGQHHCYSDINNNTKTIFIHIPKTAGSSISKALYSDMRCGHTHFYAQDYYDESPEKYISFFKFTFVRHPIDRFVSAYKYFSSIPDWVTPATHDFAEKQVHPYTNINDFVEQLSQNDDVARWKHFKSQLSFLIVNNEINMDFIGKFESLEQDMQHIATILGKGDLTLPHVNQSPSHSNKSYSLSSTSIHILREYYKEDFDSFCY